MSAGAKGQVLVTGALGVIGRTLSEQLKGAGYGVIGADLLVKDYSDYVRADVTAFEDLYEVFERSSIRCVIHAAGEVGRIVGENHPQKMVYVNNVGVLNVIKLCLKHGSRLVYFSTSEVYGHLLDKDEPVSEEAVADSASAFVTTNVYAMSKLYGEALVKHYVENYGLDAVTVRPFMVYGPGEYPSRYRSAICNFIHAAITGGEIVVHRGAVRAWCYVSDFVEGVRTVLETPRSTRYEAYNVGSDEYLTMEEVANAVVSVCGGKREQVKVVEPPNKFMSLKKRASIAKLRAVGYEPRVLLREGLARVAAWQRENVR